MTIDLFYPSPEYDWKATEVWLEKKARKGWRLIPGGNLRGLAAFERTEPTELRYRLIPKDTIGISEPEDKLPNPDAIELYQAMGWEYVTNRGRFHIYRCENPSAPEPDTDPRVLAMALKPTAIAAVLETLLWSLFIFLQLCRIPVFETAVNRNDPLWLLLPIPLAVTMLARLASCIWLLRYRHACTKGQFPEGGRRLYLPDNILLASCLMLVLLGLVVSGNNHTTPLSQVYDDYVLHEGYEWPFTIPGAEVTKSDAVSYRTFATRENWGYDGYIIMPDSSQGAIYIEYADFHFEFFARLYAWELELHTPNLIVHQGTEVYRIFTSVTIEDPESIFFPERSEKYG